MDRLLGVHCLDNSVAVRGMAREIPAGRHRADHLRIAADRPGRNREHAGIGRQGGQRSDGQQPNSEGSSATASAGADSTSAWASWYLSAQPSAMAAMLCRRMAARRGVALRTADECAEVGHEVRGSVRCSRAAAGFAMSAMVIA